MASGQIPASGSDHPDGWATVPSSKRGNAASISKDNHKDLPNWQQAIIRWRKKNLVSMWERGLSLVKRRDTDKVMQGTDVRKIVAGTLLSTAFYQPYVGPPTARPLDTIPCDDVNRTATPCGIVFSKFRKFVVVWEYEKHWLCVPLFTHDGKGLDRIREKKEHMAIRDSRYYLTEPPKTENNRGFLVAETISRTAVDTGKNYAPETITNSSYLHLTNLVSIWKDVPLTQEGHLIDGDAQRLKKAVLSLLE